MPLFGCALGLYNAIPLKLPLDDQAVSVVGSPWEHYEKVLDSIISGLNYGAEVQVVIATLFLILGYKIAGYLRGVADRLNRRFLGRWSGFICALLITTLITTAFVVIPVALPQFIQSFAVIMLFVICVVLFVVNLTLVSMRQKLPIISGVLAAAGLFSIFDWTDNHGIRLLENAEPMFQMNSQRIAITEFDKWFLARPDRANYREAYPVYLLAAQGGGIYAAYHTAIFLARLQDICPAFRHHLFAISSVSGGSIGAATFVAVLNALDREVIDTSPAPLALGEATASDPCPAITNYEQNAVLPTDAWEPGPLENAVRRALARDFLSPLVAALLFPDFTQRFLPIQIGLFDRARALEYTLEAGGKSFVKKPTREAPVVDNPFESSILKLWDAKGSIPALLMNTTDAGSGRRFVIAPFQMAHATSQRKFGALVNYQFWDDKDVDNKKARDLRLSTAAGMSARFPWLTPAATVHDARLANATKVKLVDGGYVDNSGIETILDLKNSLDQFIEQQRSNIDLNLIILNGGNFPLRKSFALGETLEPVRAVLNTRTSRAYVAIEKAERLFDSPLLRKRTFADKEWSVSRPKLKKAILENRFYELPLGWVLSNQTRSIIENQSGRFWECSPDESFTQAQQGLAPADCVQLLTYHELNRTLQTVAEHVVVSSYLIREDRRRKKDPNVDVIIACYRDRSSIVAHQDRTYNLEQTGNMRSLIEEWRGKYGGSRDALMVYMMATAAYESSEFRTRRQSLNYTSAEQILKRWSDRFKDIPASDQISVIQKRYVQKPEDLAEAIYGGLNGNDKRGDGWRYRGRGLATVIFKDSYRSWGRTVGESRLVDDPELIFIPRYNAKIFVGDYFPDKNVADMQSLLTAEKWLELRKIVLKASGQRADADETSASVKEIGEKMQIFDTCVNNSIKGTR